MEKINVAIHNQHIKKHQKIFLPAGGKKGDEKYSQRPDFCVILPELCVLRVRETRFLNQFLRIF